MRNKQDYNDWEKWTPPYPHAPHKQTGFKDPIQAPRTVTIADLFPNLTRQTIGWSPLLETLKEVTSTKPSYPPYDIVVVDETTNVLQVAVAGFSKKDLSITLQEAVLTIKGKKGKETKGTYIHHGIAAREFELNLAVAEFWKIDSAEVMDGMLSVTFSKELPEEKKPKVIDIK